MLWAWPFSEERTNVDMGIRLDGVDLDQKGIWVNLPDGTKTSDAW